MAVSATAGVMYRDIAKGVAVTCFLYAISIYLPILGFFCAVLIPLPVFYYRTKLGRNGGLLVCGGTAAVMMVVLGGPFGDVIFYIEMLMLGFVLGELVQIRLPIEKIFVYTWAVVFGAGLVSLFLYSISLQTGVVAFVKEYVQQNLQLTMTIYEGMGVSPDQIQLLRESLPQVQEILVGILPGLLTGAILLITWANVLLARSVFAKQGVMLPDYGHLNRWKAPDVLVWGVIGFGLLALIPAGTVKYVGLNGLLILMVVYFFQGVAILSFYFEKKRFPRLLKVFLYSLIGLQQLLIIVIIGIGFFDMWLNLRRLGKEPTGSD